MEDRRKYRILCIDGGGIRGIIPCILLRRLSQEVGAENLLSRVDLFAGTSTGAIIAAGLAAGEPVDQLERLYKYRGRVIFRRSLGQRITNPFGFCRARYDSSALQRELHAVLGSKKLGDLSRRLLITAFDLDATKVEPTEGKEERSWRPKVFHNFEVLGGSDDRDIEIARAVACSCAGPTYFPAIDGYIDGGVFANSPTVCALAQCLDRRLPEPPRLEDIVMLSIGTGRNPRYLPDTHPDRGWADWVNQYRIRNLLLEGSGLAADYQCTQLLGCRYHRLSVTLDHPIEMDDVKRLPELIQIAEARKLDKTVEWLREKWCD
jgi:patatin-like phospholipase/acyl hydrolase